MPSGPIRRYAAPAIGAAILAAFLSALSASPQDPPQQRPTFRVGSSFVRVDAYPLKDGKPVTDLTAEEFDVAEDGVPQKIESFEHVMVRTGGPQSEKVETSSQRESLQAAANPRNRVFVIFIDTPHVTARIAALNEALIRMMDRMLGPDDLVGVMTPFMSASQVVLGRKTQMIEDGLRKNQAFVDRFVEGLDPREEGYMECYGNFGAELPQEMIARKRERATLEALQDLVHYLKTIREERKAIITVTSGWQLFGENTKLLNLRQTADGKTTEGTPRTDPVHVGPEGKLTNKTDPRLNPRGFPSDNECDADRIRLATMDDNQFFKDVMDDANAANASFYPVDPNGLDIFASAMDFGAKDLSLAASMNTRRRRNDVLKTLAGNTDGMAVVENNDLEGGLRRISDDLTSYYLLGYSSTNTKLDGRFRSLKVRVKRPGIDVRARHGYRAPTMEEVTRARTAADTPVPDATRVVTAALNRLGGARGDVPFRINAATAIGSSSALWVTGELLSQPGRPDEFARGGTATIDATIGSTSTSAQVTLKPGERTFVVKLGVPAGATGDITVRARIAPEGGTIPYSDALRMGAATGDLQPLFFKRGVTTGNRWLPAADLRFSRTERVRLEWPVAGDAKPGSGRVLDKAGQPLQVPVTVAERVDDAAGQRWVTAELALAPLSTADYAIEVELIGPGPSRKIVTGLRVIR